MRALGVRTVLVLLLTAALIPVACHPSGPPLQRAATVEFVADEPTVVAVEEVHGLSFNPFSPGLKRTVTPIASTPATVVFPEGSWPALVSYKEGGQAPAFLAGRIDLPPTGGAMRVHVDPPSPGLAALSGVGGALGSLLAVSGYVLAGQSYAHHCGKDALGMPPEGWIVTASLGVVMVALSVWGAIDSLGSYEVERL